MLKILVTGGAGYIGSVLAEELTDLPFVREVVIVDNFMWGQASLSHLCNRRGLSIVRGDARDMRVMRHLLGKCDVFIPLAALVGAPLCDQKPLEAASTNTTAISDALQYLSSEQRVIYPNTNSGYGIGLGKDVMCTEESPLTPISHYGKTKCAAELRVLDRRRNNVVFRFATVFGMSPRMRTDLLVNDFVWRAIHDRNVLLYEPHFQRNYIHVRDAARAFVHALSDKVPGGVYNVGDTRANMSKQDLCFAIKKRLPDFEINSSAFNSDPDKRDYVVSNAKFEATGWTPTWSLDDGICELIKGYAQYKQFPFGNV